MNRATAALARSYRGERLLTTVVGLLALAGGTLALVVGQGVLGGNRAHRSVVDPLALGWLHAHAVPARIGALVLGVALLVLGVRWFLRTLRPESRPNLELDDELTVTASAIADAVRADTETLEGVARARVRLVGEPGEPALRISLWLSEGADLRSVWQELDGSVLRRARTSLGVHTLPTAVRVELDTVAGQRVR